MLKNNLVARSRLRTMIDATPANRRRAFRLRIAKSMGFKGKDKNLVNQVRRIETGKARMTPKRRQRIAEYYRRRANGEVAGVTVPDIKFNEYLVVGRMEYTKLTQFAVDSITAEELDRLKSIWIANFDYIIVEDVSQIRAFIYAVIERGSGFLDGSFQIPWSDMGINASGMNVRVMASKFNKVVKAAFRDVPPTGGYRIVAIAFNATGAREIADAYGTEVDAFNYDIVLESKRKVKGKEYNMRLVE